MSAEPTTTAAATEPTTTTETPAVVEETPKETKVEETEKKPGFLSKLLSSFKKAAPKKAEEKKVEEVGFLSKILCRRRLRVYCPRLHQRSPSR